MSNFDYAVTRVGRGAVFVHVEQNSQVQKIDLVFNHTCVVTWLWTLEKGRDQIGCCGCQPIYAIATWLTYTAANLGSLLSLLLFLYHILLCHAIYSHQLCDRGNGHPWCRGCIVKGSLRRPVGSQCLGWRQRRWEAYSHPLGVVRQRVLNDGVKSRVKILKEQSWTAQLLLQMGKTAVDCCGNGVLGWLQKMCPQTSFSK